jgi:pimeloyl-ACP methyl ester carboxylesterase
MTINQYTEYTTTRDGWKLRFYHYRPETSEQLQPVILCHGLMANKNSCDFGDFETPEWRRYSLASYLANSSPPYDVWVPELRGNGNPTFTPQEHPEKYRWTINDYIDKDVPAIVKHVQEWHHSNFNRTPQVFWVGKSMGGMLAYAYGEARAGHRAFRGVVTLGSPVIFSDSNKALEFIARIMPRNIAFPLETSLLRTSPEIRQNFLNVSVNQDNVDPKILNQYLQEGIQKVISSKLLSHFCQFIRNDNFSRYPRFPWLYEAVWRGGYYCYTDHLPSFTTPLLAIAGGQDHLCTKKDLKYVIEHVGSGDKSYLEFSKEAGFHIDYGHLDLNIGLEASNEVYPRIVQWLSDRTDESSC